MTESAFKASVIYVVCCYVIWNDDQEIVFACQVLVNRRHMLPKTNSHTYVWGRYLIGIAELLNDLGFTVDGLVQQTDCPPEILYGTAELIPYAYCGYVLEEAARYTGRNDFAILLAKKRLEVNYARDPLIYMRASETLGQALHGSLQHMRTRSMGVLYGLEHDERMAWVTRSLGSAEDSRYPQGSLLFFATIQTVLKDISNGQFAPSRVTIISRKTVDTAAVENFFHCPIDFNADQDAMFFPVQHLNYELPARDDNLRHLLSEYLTSQHLQPDSDFRETVKNAVIRNLTLGRTDIEAVAMRLPFRPRTIQRKLNKLGTSYQEVLREARFELAENLLLNSDNRMTYIAQRLVYNDLSAFSKAFKAQYGMSPLQWRKLNSEQ